MLLNKVIFLNLSKYFSILFVTIFLTSVSARPIGTESGGGGTVYKGIDGNWKLLDFKGFKYKESYFYSILNKTHFSVVETRFYLEEKSKEPVFQQVKNILDLWGGIKLDIFSGYLNMAIDNLNFEFTNSSLPKEQYAAYYHKTSPNIFQVFISNQKWNKMSGFDQAGLLIHEIYRQIQIGNEFRFNDRALKKATALTVFCKPSIRLSSYIFYLIMDEAYASKIYGSFNHYMEEKCH